MSELEPLLRKHFSAEADEVPVDANLLDGVDRLRRGRRHRRLVGGGSALAVAVIVAAVAVPLAVVGHHGGTTGVTVGANQPAAPVKPPPGERAVTWAGIQLFVPAMWSSVSGEGDTSVCAGTDHPGGVVGYESDIPIAASACAPAAHPVLEQLQLRTSYGLAAAHNGVVTSSGPHGRACPATVSTQLTSGDFAGLAANCIGARMLGQLITTVQVPSLDAAFQLTTNTQARANAILASAHLVSVDENGCAVDQPANLQKVAGGGAGGPQVRGAPVSGVVCSYSGRRLVMGVTLSAKDLATITADLNRLPARYTSAELAAQQVPNTLDRGGLASIMLTQADGRTQQITVRGALPGVRPGVAGATQSTLTQALSADLSDALPSGFGANAFVTGPGAQLPPG